MNTVIKIFMIALGLAACDGAQPDTRVQLTGTARKPLVLVGGQTEQIPTADYLSSPGGASFNATPATGAGDIEVTTINGGATPGPSGGGLYNAIMSAKPTQISTGLTTWGNQPTGATVTDSAQGMSVFVPNQGSVASNAMLIMTAPSTPYSIKILASVTSPQNDNLGMEFGWVKSGSGGKALSTIWDPSANAATALSTLQIALWNSYTSYSSSPYASYHGNLSDSTFADHVLWWRLKDDGTTASIAYSASGDDWETLYSVTKSGSFLGTYDLIEFGAHGFTGEIYTEILSWKVTTP